jgi:glucokinase
VKDRRCRTTNLPWVVDAQALERDLGLSHVALANDFVALARGIPAVEPAQLFPLHAGARDPQGPCAILGAGTGLGEAILVPVAGREPLVLATEGGHATFAPRDELEGKVQRFLAARHGHVSWERLVCGEGLVNLVEALSASLDLPIPERVGSLLVHDRAAAPPQITAAARAGEPLCTRALQLFCSLYGAEAGNLALKCLPTGGVFVAGGIAPRMLPELQGGLFAEGYLAKGRMRAVLEAFSVQVVLDEEVALRGAALLAAGAGPPSAVTESVTESSS